METDPPDLDTIWLSRLLKENHYCSKPIEILNTSVETAVPKGENYASVVSRVKLQCLLASGAKKTFSVIVKTELASEKAREILALSVFRSETMTYTTTLKEMESLAEEFGDRREKIWPTLYGYKPYKMLALEDLTDLDYAVAQRRNQLDLNHSMLVLRSVARFHAMSKVLLSRGLLNDDDKRCIILAADKESMKRLWEITMIVLSECIEKSWGSGWEEIATKIRNITHDTHPRMAAMAADYDKRFEVLNHGDLWTCNLMFKKMEYENFPVSVRFIDFQVCNLNSFIWDVEYFISTSVNAEFRRKSKPEMLKCYHEALVKNLEFFQYSGYVPTFEDVESESNRIEFAQFAITTLSSISSADSTDAFDMEKLMTHLPTEVIKPEVFSSSKAKLNLGDDLKYFAANGTI